MTILSPIKHIVVVMFENRSLDHMLGGLYPSGSAPSAARMLRPKRSRTSP